MISEDFLEDEASPWFCEDDKQKLKTEQKFRSFIDPNDPKAITGDGEMQRPGGRLVDQEVNEFRVGLVIFPLPVSLSVK